jgi:catechol 2,3-dioxygenase
MQLPQTSPDPPFHVTRLSHVVMNVGDLEACRAFYEELIGLVVTEADDEAVYLRGVEEAAHHSLVLRRTKGAPTAERIGFRVASEADLDAAKDHFERRGLPAAWAEVPHQGRTLQVADVAGVPIEYCVTMPVERRLVIDHHLHRGAAAARIDHLQVHVPDVRAFAAFHCDLGFRISEYATTDGDPDGPLLVTFLTRKGDLLDLVGAHNPGPRLHHFSFLVHDASYTLQHVADIASGLGMRDAIEHGPARHGLAPQQFLYVRAPDGHRVELVSQGYQFIDPELEPLWWERSNPRAGATWGPAPAQRWVTEASHFAGVEPQPPRDPAAVASGAEA